MIYISSTGNVYWVNAIDFPSANYKNLLINGISGMGKAVVSSNGKMLAVGGSN